MTEQNVISFKPVSADNVHKFRKERAFYKSICLIDCEKKETVLDIRFYSAGMTTYCCAWLAWGYGPEALNDGARAGAKATGGGYHKESAAMQYALVAMGFKFEQDFSGVGDGAMRRALEAVARYLNMAERYMIHEAHA